MSRAPVGRLLQICTLAVVAALTACQARRAASAGARTMPEAAEERIAAVDQLASSLFDGLRNEAGLGELMADGRMLDALLVPAARARVQVERSAGSLPRAAPWAEVWGGYEYAGFCAQGARPVQPGGPLGLREPAWVLDRLLIVASFGPLRGAAWVDGSFVYTTEGWKAIAVSRVEAPRAGHADLELAPCDVQRGVR